MSRKRAPHNSSGDVRITSIYEGTNGIQAADLLNRKLARDGGATMQALQQEIRALGGQLAVSDEPILRELGVHLADALAGHELATQHLLDQYSDDRFAALSGSFDYMMQTGYLFGGWQLARAAMIAADKLAAGENSAFLTRKLATARFYMHRILPRTRGHAAAIVDTSGTLAQFDNDWF
jgi:hypothetical protein